MSLQLSDKHRHLVQEVLARYVPTMVVWAHGSRVMDVAHAASDLDLVVRNPGNLALPQTNLGVLRQAFHDSALPISVDVQDWARLPDSFQREIEQQYCVIAH